MGFHPLNAVSIHSETLGIDDVSVSGDGSSDVTPGPEEVTHVSPWLRLIFTVIRIGIANFQPWTDSFELYLSLENEEMSNRYVNNSFWIYGNTEGVCRQIL